MKELTSAEVARLLERGTPQDAAKLLVQLDRGYEESDIRYCPGHNPRQTLELVDQNRLEEIWLLGPKVRSSMISLSWEAPFLARLSDRALRVTLAHEGEDYEVIESVLWHIVRARRAALYDEVLRRSDSVRWVLACGLDQIDPRLTKALVQQSFERLKAGQNVEKELDWLLYEFCTKPLDAFGIDWEPMEPSNLPFLFLQRAERRWIAEHYPAQVARVVGYHIGMPIPTYSSVEKALEKAFCIIQKAGPEEMEFHITDRVNYKQVLAFNRQVVSARDETPDNALLIKEGFGWRVEAKAIWPNYTTGGWSITTTDAPEYNVTVAVEPRRWLYRSRSGRSVLQFERREEKWKMEGRASLNCLRELVKMGIDPDVQFGVVFKASTLIDAFPREILY